ncbi:MAG: allantoicase [Hyphomicrobiales bacterium]
MSDALFIAAEKDPRADELAATWVDLAHPRLGTKVIYATDDFFAPKERLISPEPPIFVPGKYDENGKWMDGWESRRKRVEGHDWCIIRLGRPGRIRGVDIDTSHFTGNYPPEASLQVWSGEGDPGEDAEWTELVPRMSLEGNSHHVVKTNPSQAWTHVRLDIFPDGGIARLRLYGEVEVDFSSIGENETIDLLAVENGGRAVACNDSHFGAPANMLAPGRGVNMGDGWETARRRVPGNDWAVLRLGSAGTVDKIVIDTCHFKGNFPDRFSLQGARIDGESRGEGSEEWPELFPQTKLSADIIHEFNDGIADLGPITHVRLNIFPDGGVSRLRLFGKVAK